MTRRIFTPREYSGAAISHLLEHKRCALLARMGMGKTVLTASALDMLNICGYLEAPTLVLAPLRVAQSVWPDEFAKWEHLKDLEIHTIVGDAKTRKANLTRALEHGNTAVYTMNYENLPWLAETLERDGEPWPFRNVIADESTKLKGVRLKQGTARTQAIRDVAHTHVDRWINLTGTPAPNGLMDLWGQMWFIDKGQRLGVSYNAFLNRWFRAMPTRGDYPIIEPMPHASEEIQERIKDVCLTLDPRDYFDMKEPIVDYVRVELPGKARALYKQMENKMFIEIEGQGIEAFNTASKTMKCLQLANGAVYTEPDDGSDTRAWAEVHDAKLQALESIVSESGGTPIVVVHRFKSDLARLRKAFPNGKALDDNPDTITKWNKGEIPMLFTHPASAGHGLNLQDGGNILVFFGHDWNLEWHDQVIERIGPMRQLQSGHDRNVFIYYIVANDTLDDAVLEKLKSKSSTQEILLRAMKRRKTNG